MSFIKSIGEYLEAFKLGIQNGDKIMQGLVVSAQVKNGKINEDALAEILRRKDICAACPHNSKNAKADGTYTSSLPYEHCILCHCRIGYDDSKEYCLNCNCGAEVWNKQHPGQPLEVRWTAFDLNKKENN